MMLKLAVAGVVVAVLSSVTTFGVFEYRRGRIVASESLHLETFPSHILAETREVIVRLPASYARDTARRYPVIYALDGSSLDEPTAAGADMLARIGVMPEAIVVGLPNVSGEGRQRDYTPPGMRQDIDDPDSPTGAADRFLTFLRDEAIPWVDTRYRTTERRLLAGWSRSGLFVWYSVMADPGLFEARLAHSPALWREDGKAVAAMETFLQTRQAPTAIYLSLGTEENAQMSEGFARGRRVLEAHAARAGLTWRADLTEAATHQTNPALATPVGLDWYFRGRLTR